MEILKQYGKKACIGNFSTGTPEGLAQIWEAFEPALRAAKDAGGILGLHEYGPNSMMDFFDTANGEGCHSGRYRPVYFRFLEPANLDIPLVITECGIDAGGNPETDGWQVVLSGDADEYLRQLKWYDSLLQGDAWVWGATIFQMDDATWPSFEIRGALVQKLIEYAISQPPAPAGRPDVVVDRIHWSPENPTPGQRVRFSATVSSIGNVATNESSRVSEQGVVSVNFRVDGVTVASGSTEAMGPGTSAAITSTGEWTATAGTHRVVAIVDDHDRFLESNENNNQRESSLRVSSDTRLPDVLVQSISTIPERPCEGQAVTFRARVKNQGHASTADSLYSGQPYVVSVSYWVNDDYMTLGSRGPLAANETTGENDLNGVTQWIATRGQHTLRVKADDPNRFQKTNESNNEAQITFTIEACPSPPGAFSLTSAISRCYGDDPAIDLEWSPSSHATRYDVHRILSGNDRVLAQLSTDSRSYDDGDVLPATRYSYYIWI